MNADVMRYPEWPNRILARGPLDRVELGVQEVHGDDDYNEICGPWGSGDNSANPNGTADHQPKTGWAIAIAPGHVLFNTRPTGLMTLR